jgi:hypothetical protein
MAEEFELLLENVSMPLPECIKAEPGWGAAIEQEA